VRSSGGQFVKASGLRWLSLMLLPEIPWAGRYWCQSSPLKGICVRVGAGLLLSMNCPNPDSHG
jgi:hypothetical protein